MAYDNTNRGVIFVNDRKEREGQPDRSGSINVEGVEYFLDGWIKTSESGRQFMSLSVKRKEKQPQAAPRQDQPRQAPRTHGDRPGGPKNRPSTGFDDMGEDCPF